MAGFNLGELHFTIRAINATREGIDAARRDFESLKRDAEKGVRIGGLSDRGSGGRVDVDTSPAMQKLRELESQANRTKAAVSSVMGGGGPGTSLMRVGTAGSFQGGTAGRMSAFSMPIVTDLPLVTPAPQQRMFPGLRPMLPAPGMATIMDVSRPPLERVSVGTRPEFVPTEVFGGRRMSRGERDAERQSSNRAMFDSMKELEGWADEARAGGRRKAANENQAFADAIRNTLTDRGYNFGGATAPSSTFYAGGPSGGGLARRGGGTELAGRSGGLAYGRNPPWRAPVDEVIDAEWYPSGGQRQLGGPGGPPGAGRAGGGPYPPVNAGGNRPANARGRSGGFFGLPRGYGMYMSLMFGGFEAGRALVAYGQGASSGNYGLTLTEQFEVQAQSTETIRSGVLGATANLLIDPFGTNLMRSRAIVRDAELGTSRMRQTKEIANYVRDVGAESRMTGMRGATRVLAGAQFERVQAQDRIILEMEKRRGIDEGQIGIRQGAMNETFQVRKLQEFDRLYKSGAMGESEERTLTDIAGENVRQHDRQEIGSMRSERMSQLIQLQKSMEAVQDVRLGAVTQDLYKEVNIVARTERSAGRAQQIANRGRMTGPFADYDAAVADRLGMAFTHQDDMRQRRLEASGLPEAMQRNMLGGLAFKQSQESIAANRSLAMQQLAPVVQAVGTMFQNVFQGRINQQLLNRNPLGAQIAGIDAEQAASSAKIISETKPGFWRGARLASAAALSNQQKQIATQIFGDDTLSIQTTLQADRDSIGRLMRHDPIGAQAFNIQGAGIAEAIKNKDRPAQALFGLQNTAMNLDLLQKNYLDAFRGTAFDPRNMAISPRDTEKTSETLSAIKEASDKVVQAIDRLTPE